MFKTLVGGGKSVGSQCVLASLLLKNGKGHKGRLGADARVGRLCNPSSEMHFAEHSFASGALGEPLGIPAEKVNGSGSTRLLPFVVKTFTSRYFKHRRLFCDLRELV